MRGQEDNLFLFLVHAHDHLARDKKVELKARLDGCKILWDKVLENLKRHHPYFKNPYKRRLKMANDDFDNAQTDKEMNEKFNNMLRGMNPEIQVGCKNYSTTPISEKVRAEIKIHLDALDNLAMKHDFPYMFIMDTGVGAHLSWNTPEGVSYIYPDIIPVLSKFVDPDGWKLRKG